MDSFNDYIKQNIKISINTIDVTKYIVDLITFDLNDENNFVFKINEKDVINETINSYLLSNDNIKNDLEQIICGPNTIIKYFLCDEVIHNCSINKYNKRNNKFFVNSNKIIQSIGENNFSILLLNIIKIQNNIIGEYNLKINLLNHNVNLLNQRAENSVIEEYNKKNNNYYIFYVTLIFYFIFLFYIYYFILNFYTINKEFESEVNNIINLFNNNLKKYIDFNQF